MTITEKDLTYIAWQNRAWADTALIAERYGVPRAIGRGRGV